MSIDLDHQYKKWISRGSSLDQNGSVPHEVKMYYVLRTARDFGLRTFVESGTSHGDGVYAMLPHVDEVHTIEAWKEAYDFSAKRFAGDSKVTIYFGDSGEILPDILEKVGPSVFWLDAHYSGDGTAMLDKETPVIAELDAIAATGSKEHAIVIDDARGFGVWNDYPTIDWVEDYVKASFPNHEFSLEGDEIFILPRKS